MGSSRRLSPGTAQGPPGCLYQVFPRHPASAQIQVYRGFGDCLTDNSAHTETTGTRCCGGISLCFNICSDPAPYLSHVQAPNTNGDRQAASWRRSSNRNNNKKTPVLSLLPLLSPLLTIIIGNACRTFQRLTYSRRILRPHLPPRL